MNQRISVTHARRGEYTHKEEGERVVTGTYEHVSNPASLSVAASFSWHMYALPHKPMTLHHPMPSQPGESVDLQPYYISQTVDDELTKEDILAERNVRMHTIYVEFGGSGHF